jgi:hypothetical protein
VKRLLVLLAVLALALPAAAEAKQLTVSSGQVKATLTYSKNASGFGYKGEKLTIARAGQTLFDGVPGPGKCRGTCDPTVGFGSRQPPLIVRDVDEDSEPEVVYTAYTGGAHCCIVAQFYALSADSTHYAPVSHFFGDPGFGIEDLDHNGELEVVTADDAFAYRFTSYAFSGLPLLVLRYSHGVFTDLTTSFPGRLRAESARFWRNYKKLRGNSDDTPRGQISAWAADQYRLGHRKHALAVLRAQGRRGFLAHPGGAAKFIARLDRFLRKHGYTSP